MRPAGELLHPSYIDLDISSCFATALYKVRPDLGNEPGTNVPITPDMTVAVQACNDSPEDLWSLYNDIEAQTRDVHGDVQLLFVDGSNISYAVAAVIEDIKKEKSEHIRQINYASVKRGPNFRADLLNTIVKRAETNYVYTTVGHASLSNTLTLDEAAYILHKSQKDNIAAAYGISLPGKNASFYERAGARLLGVKRLLKEDSPKTVRDPNAMGVLAVESLAFRKDVVQELGSFPVEYGAGGMGEMASKILDAEFGIVRMTELAVHHSHGLNAINSLRQLRAWQHTSQPMTYSEQKWAWHPNRGL